MTDIHIPIKTARIHSVFGGYSVLMDGKRFLFAQNHSDVEEMDKLLNHLGFVTAITYNTDKGVRLV